MTFHFDRDPHDAATTFSGGPVAQLVRAEDSKSNNPGYEKSW
jgi:hypothetical protein